jgi:anti-repressor protein
MQELIKVATNAEGKKVVSARELHKFLEVTERFSSWFERQIQYGFVENVDFLGCKVFNALAKQELDDFALTLDCAKEISMIQRTDKGKEARLYFIECEKQLANNLPKDYLSSLRALVKSEEEKLAEREAKLLAQQTVAILTHVNKTYTSSEIGKELGFKSANELNKKLHDLGIQYKQNETWILYSKYSNLAYVDIKQEVLDSGRVVYHRKWTQIGREFLIKLLKNN